MHQLQKIIISDLTVLQEFQVKSDYVCPWTKVLPHVTMHPFIPALLPPSMRANGAHSKHWPPGHKSIPKGYFSFSCSQILKNQAASLTRSQAENCSQLAAIPVPTHASSGPVGASGIQMKQSHSDVTVLPLFQGEVKGKKSCKGE